MRRTKPALILTVLLVLAVFVGPVRAADFPRPSGPINDFAGVLSATQRARMSALAREVQQKTGASLVVATFKNLGGSDIETFANELFSAWGIGQKGKDNGLLFLIALKERRMRIEVGYGLEGIIPDGLAGRIRDQYMLPYFKKGQFGTGLENGLVAAAQVIAKDAGVRLTGAPQARAAGGKTKAGFGGLGFFVLLALFFLIGRRGRRGILPWIILGGLMGGGGRSSGGGGGFGGFGGFGGGMSGGGGASGGW